ncbi:MAG: YggT family protein [Chloroflexi bacterium]|nr:YggT family protein [Chloroflexota bacterium]
MGQFQNGLQSFLLLLLQALEVLIFIRVILSWFPISAENRLVRLLMDVTEPVIAPFRRVIPQIGMFDLSTLAALLTIQFLSGAIAGRGFGF